MHHRRAALLALAAVGLATGPGPASAAVYVQFFETPWAEVESRLIELVVVGYDALWLPPPQKGNDGARDVGFAPYDRFDLGDTDQRGGIPTRYGTRANLLSMTGAADRVGLRVFFDIVMNHNGNPSLNENVGNKMPLVGLDGYPDVVMLDYHVLPARALPGQPGSYEARRPDALGGGTIVISPKGPGNPEAVVAAAPIPPGQAASFPGWTHFVRAPHVDFDAGPFNGMNYSLLGLLDFALDMDGVNATLGTPLPSWVRQPDCPSCYPGGVPVAENIIEYTFRWVVWLMEETGADGYRLDAVKHASEEYFVAFNQLVQDTYDAERGNLDGDDRDLRHDAVLFGESFSGNIFGDLKDYYETGMQMLNFPLFFTMNGLFSDGGGHGDMGQLSHPQGGEQGGLHEFGGLGRHAGITFAQSHDSLPPAAQADLAYAFILTRIGDSVVFFDGNNFDTRTFVKPGRPDALGDLGSKVITRLVWIHNHLARGGMWNRFVDDDAYVYERVAPGGATLLVVLHDNIGADGRVGPDGVARFGEFDARPLLVTAFPPGTVLVELTGHGPVRETTVLDPAAVTASARNRALAEYDRSSDFGLPSGYGLVHVAVPSGPRGNYAMYAPRLPQGPRNGARAVSIVQAGQRVEDVTLETVGERRTSSGARVAEHYVTLARATARRVTVQVRTDGSTEQAFVRLNVGGTALAGRPVVTGSPEGAFDGYVALDAAGSAGGGDRLWELRDVDLAHLPDGVHYFQVRAMRVSESGAVVWNTFVAPMLVDRQPGDGPLTEPLDRDGDGVATAEDNCPRTWNATQADFDDDVVGDECDFCPLSGPAPMLDGDGCKALTDDEVQSVYAVVDDVMEGRASLRELVVMVDTVNQ